MCCSVTGAPGVTSAALAVAALWPADQDVLLVEADASGGDLVPRLTLRPEHGITSLATATRHGVATAGLSTHAQPVRIGGRLIGVVAAPVGMREAHSAVGAAVASGVLALTRDAAVITDLGRLQAPDLRRDTTRPQAAGVESGQSSWQLLREADLVLLVTAARADALSHVDALREDLLSAAGSRLRLLVIDDGPYGAREIADAVACPVAGMIPHDPRGVVLLRPNGPNTLVRTRLGRAVRQLVRGISDDLAAKYVVQPTAAREPQAAGAVVASVAPQGSALDAVPSHAPYASPYPDPPVHSLPTAQAPFIPISSAPPSVAGATGEVPLMWKTP